MWFWGSFSPKIFGAKNVVFHNAILRLHCKYLKTGTRYRRPENGVATTIPLVHDYQIWWTLVHKRRKWDSFSTHSKSTFLDARRGVKGRCSLKKCHSFKGWPTLVNAYPNRDGSVPSNFLTPKIRQLAKNMVYCGLYRRGLLGELHQTFLLDVSV